MTGLTLAATLALSSLGPAGSAPPIPERPPPDGFERPTLELAPIPSLLPAPPAETHIVAALDDGPSTDEERAPQAYTGLSRRKSGAAILVSSLLALGASFAVMPLADAIAPEDSPNQGAMVARLELVCYSAGAAVVGGYLLLSDLWASRRSDVTRTALR